MKVDIRLIDGNRWRNTRLYPINESQVKRLMNSMESHGDWGKMPARVNPDFPNRYEIAAGHHRLEAARRKGYKTVDIEVRKRSEDDMIHTMIIENATQRGTDPSAIFDSAHACIFRVMQLALEGHKDVLAKIGHSLNDLRNAIKPETILNKYLADIEAGLGVKSDAVRRYSGGALSGHEVIEAIECMKASHLLHGIYKELIDIYRDDEESNRILMAGLKQLTATSPLTLNAKVIHLFEKITEVKVFRDTITGHGAKKYIPLTEQVSVAKLVLNNRTKRGRLPSTLISKTLTGIILSASGSQRVINKRERDALLAKSVNARVARAGSEIQKGANEIRTALAVINEVLETHPESIMGLNINQVHTLLTRLINDTKKLDNEIMGKAQHYLEAKK